MKKFTIATLAVVVCTMGIWAQAVRRDGKWEVKTEMSMPGMTMNIPPSTTTTCVTKEEADDPAKQAVPQGRGGPSDCKISDYKVDGNKVTYKISCPSQNATGTGEMNYTTDAYTGTLTLDMNMGGRSMAMVSKMTGKRLGDCTK